MKGFYHIWAWWPSWSCDPVLNKFSFPQLMEAPHEIWLRLAKRFWRRRSLKIVDGRMDDRECLYYELTNEPKGSGELKQKKRKKKKTKRKKLVLKEYNFTPHMTVYICQISNYKFEMALTLTQAAFRNLVHFEQTNLHVMYTQMIGYQGLEYHRLCFLAVTMFERKNPDKTIL